MPWYEILISQFDNWLAKPLPSVLLAILGAYAGYLASRLRHAGKIDALDERIKFRDEQIKVKDDTIRGLNAPTAPIPSGRTYTRDAAPASGTKPHRHTNEEDDRLSELYVEEAIRSAIDSTTYKFVYNPATEHSKTLTFLPNGNIGRGQNNNENRWRVANGRLEILDSQGTVYSRFTLLDDGISFHHTNEPDTRSLRGQYMVPDHSLASVPLH